MEANADQVELMFDVSMKEEVNRTLMAMEAHTLDDAAASAVRQHGDSLATRFIIGCWLLDNGALPTALRYYVTVLLACPTEEVIAQTALRQQIMTVIGILEPEDLAIELLARFALGFVQVRDADEDYWRDVLNFVRARSCMPTSWDIARRRLEDGH